MSAAGLSGSASAPVLRPLALRFHRAVVGVFSQACVPYNVHSSYLATPGGRCYYYYLFVPLEVGTLRQRERERGEMTLPASPWELGVEPELKPRPSSCRIQVLTVLSCRLSNRALGFQIINNYNDSDKKQTKKTTRSSARKVSVSRRNHMTLQAAEPSSELAFM